MFQIKNRNPEFVRIAHSKPQDTRLKISIWIGVPNTRLDTVIKTIAKQIDFLDYRVIKADDV